MSSISTRRGDDGTTSLLYGQRVSKAHPQIEAVGALDELNVAIGAVRAAIPANSSGERERPGHLLLDIQKALVALMGEVSCAESDLERFEKSSFAKIGSSDVARLDAEVAALEARLPVPKDWVMPGNSPREILLEQARVAARLAERRITGLADHGRNVRPELRQYINRLSDLLWLVARDSAQ